MSKFFVNSVKHLRLKQWIRTQKVVKPTHF